MNRIYKDLSTGNCGSYTLINKVSGVESGTQKNLSYIRFSHTKNLLQQKYHQFILSLDNMDILENFQDLLKAQQMNDGEFDKLLHRIEKWNDLEIPVPLAYINFIGLKTICIETSVRADMKNFKEALKKSFYPECFYINTPSGVFKVGLSEKVKEKEAVEIALEFSHHEEIIARYICIKGLKTIVIESNRDIYTLTYPPILSLRKKLFIPGQMGCTCQGIKLP